MGLSNTPKETITSYQLLLDIAQSLRTLTSDSKALEKAARDAYALPEAEQKKADSARSVIAQAEAEMKAVNKQKADLEKLAEKTEAARLAARAFEDGLNKREAALAKREAALDAEYSAFKEREQTFSMMSKTLEADAQRISAKQVELSKREELISETEAKLREKAKQFKVLTEGL